MKNISPWLDTVPDRKKFPALNQDTQTDIVVIGGGIVGVLTAYQLSQEHHVILLEENHIGTGDTGLTTGFLTRVPETSLAHARQTYGELFVKKLVAAGRDAQQYIFSLISEKNINCDFVKCKTYFGSYESSDSTLADEWSAIRDIDMLTNWRAEFPCKEAIEFNDEGKFHSRKFLHGLLEKMTSANLGIYEETEVAEIEVADDGVKISANSHIIRAKKIVIATGLPISAFRELQEVVTPKLTYVIGMRYEDGAPISEDLFWDTFDPYFYYRRIDEKTIIIGGCDHVQGEKLEKNPFETLEEFAEKYFQKKGEKVYQWSGSLFMSQDGIPYAFAHPQFPNQVFVATGLGGNGLIFGTCMSRMLTKLVNGQQDDVTELFSHTRTGAKISRHIPQRIPQKIKTWIPVAALDDLKKTRMLCANAKGTKIALFNIGGKIYALNNTCTHAGGSLCEGELTGATIQCPLHGAKFDIATGNVIEPPATRSVRSYHTRIIGNIIEIEIEAAVESSSQVAQSTSAASTDRPNRKTLLIFAALALVFWMVQFAYQYFTQVERKTASALIRSFSFTGATLISFALIASSIFKWWPQLSIHWRIRRYLGVAGFTFIALHILAVEKFIFNWDVIAAYTSLNPIKNPIIYGSIAFTILFFMAATSNDYAVEKLGASRWKFLHRFVYLAYLAAILHFIQMNPPALNNVSGYLLLTATSLALLGQLFWYVATVRRRGFRKLGTWMGIIIIILYIIGGYLYVYNNF